MSSRRSRSFSGTKPSTSEVDSFLMTIYRLSSPDTRATFATRRLRGMLQRSNRWQLVLSAGWVLAGLSWIGQALVLGARPWVYALGVGCMAIAGLNVFQLRQASRPQNVDEAGQQSRAVPSDQPVPPDQTVPQGLPVQQGQPIQQDQPVQQSQPIQQDRPVQPGPQIQQVPQIQRRQPVQQDQDESSRFTVSPDPWQRGPGQ
jgi:hypothetical protein